MSSNILAINRQVLTPELVADAAKDARKLRRDIGWLGVKADLRDTELEFDGALVSPFMRITIDDESKSVLKCETPSLLSLLEEIDLIPTAIDGLQGIQLTRIRELTINYLDKGTVVNRHRDRSDDGMPKVSRVATLCGKGLFGIITLPEEDPIEPMEVAAGDLHELFNPAEQLQRPLHWANSTDDTEDRISIAFQVPAIIE